jgi:hypothetical protein
MVSYNWQNTPGNILSIHPSIQSFTQFKNCGKNTHKNLSNATWEAEVRRITAQGQPRQNVSETLSQSIAGHGGAYLLYQLPWGV